MKHYTCLLGILCLLWGVAACGVGEVKRTVEIKEVKDTSATIVVTNVDTLAIDTMIVAPNVTYEEERELTILRVDSLVKELNVAYQQMQDKQGRYIEQVPFTSFLGNEVEVGELEISKIGDQFVRVHADYFDGAPIGGKLFFVNKGELLGVEVLKLTEEVTENGRVVVENTTHIFYYDQEQVLQIWDNKKQEEIESNSITWAEENIEQWELIKKSL